MSTARVTEVSLSEEAKIRLAENNSKVSKYNRQISSGNALYEISDNPLVVGSALNSKAYALRADQYNSNADKAQAVGESTGKALNEFNGALNRASELAVLTSNPMYLEQFSVYAVDANQTLEQALKVVNSKYGSDFLFAGTNTSVEPFVATRDGNGDIISISFAGNTNNATLNISENATIEHFADSNTTSGLLSTLNGMIAFRDALVANDPNAVQTALTSNIVPSGSTVAEAIARNGTNLNRIEIARVQNSFDKLANEKAVAKEISADIAQASVNLKKAEMAYNAGVEVYANILGDQGLLKYLN